MKDIRKFYCHHSILCTLFAFPPASRAFFAGRFTVGGEAEGRSYNTSNVTTCHSDVGFVLC